MDFTIGDDQEDVVNLVLDSLRDVLNDLLDDGSEVGRSMETNELKLLSVLSKDALSALNFRVAQIAIEGETMADVVGAHEARDTSETVNREGLV